MQQKLLRIALVGKTNAGKSTLLNKIIGETVSIINKKINTTQELIKGIINISNIQIIFYDTPGLNFLKHKDKLHKKIRINFWQAIDESDIILYILDSKYIYINELEENLNKLNKKIVLVFNKIDLIEKDKLLPIIKQIDKSFKIKSFFNISAKYNLGTNNLLNYLVKLSKISKWIFIKDEISNKDDIFITNECTRNAILTYLHKELPYNINIVNQYYKHLKNGDLKIKQKLIINNLRYRKIILGKKGEKIKKIREFSQNQISKILNCKTHLYLEVIRDNAN